VTRGNREVVERCVGRRSSTLVWSGQGRGGTGTVVGERRQRACARVRSLREAACVGKWPAEARTVRLEQLGLGLAWRRRLDYVAWRTSQHGQAEDSFGGTQFGEVASYAVGVREEGARFDL